MNQKQIYNPDRNHNSVCATDMRAYAFSTFFLEAGKAVPVQFMDRAGAVERIFRGDYRT